MARRRHGPKHPYDSDFFNQASEVDATAPPCFNFDVCGGTSVACKGGRSLCRKCLEKVPGREFPLKAPITSGILRRIDYELNLAGAYPRV